MHPSAAARILGVEPNASHDDVKRAYRNKCKQWHPDRHAQKSETEMKHAEQQFKEVSNAYQTLTTPRDSDRGSDGLNPFFNNHTANFDQPFHDPFEMFSQVFGNHSYFSDDFGFDDNSMPNIHQSMGFGIPMGMQMRMSMGMGIPMGVIHDAVQEEIIITEMQNGKRVSRKIVTVNGQIVSNDLLPQVKHDKHLHRH